MKRKIDEQDVWKPSMDDVRKLEESMSSFEKKEVNGRKQYPFELYLESRGVIKFGEYGEKIVCAPEAYWRMNEVYSLYQWKKEKDLEAVFEQFPEEKEAYGARIKSMFVGTVENMKIT